MRIKLRFVIVIACAGVVIAGADIAFGAIPASERNALIAIYDSTGGPAWDIDAGWLGPPGTECAWHGVICDPAEEHVEGVHLEGNHLVGPLPADIEDLPMLRSLLLNWNNIHGPLPTEIGSLNNLDTLQMVANLVGGQIPTTFGNLANLVFLDLSHNLLTGPLPGELGNLTGLIDLRFADNRLEGSIPPELGNLSNLVELHLWQNRLSGSIPPELGNLNQLINLSIDNNRLEGPVPAELASLSNIEWMNLSWNELTGPIPHQLATLPQLWFLGLDHNHLVGSIPPEFGTFQNLVELHLEGNDLSGAIPPELGNIATLHWLFMSWNRLTGPIPPELGNLTNLIGLFLDSNLLNGPIPPGVGNMSSLEELNLAWNHLNGSIPPEIGNLASLRTLDLNRNSLEGVIPPEIGNLLALENLFLESNRILGEIPPQITNLTALHGGNNMIGFNGVHTADPGVEAFMDDKFNPGWRDTQTVAPDNLAVDFTTGISAGLSWAPIPYQWDHGGYLLMVADNPGGPYIAVTRTLGKQMAYWPLFDLDPNSTYYVKLCTVTEPHPANDNTIVSELTDPVMVNTTGDASTWYAATTGVPGNDCATPATPCPTVNDAIQRAAVGERVMVAAGTYPEGITIDRVIQIIGDDPSTTTLDAGGQGTVVWINWGQRVQISNLTLQNGSIFMGAGIFQEPQSALELADSIVTDNHAHGFGGGLFVEFEGGARLERVALIDNTANEQGGGVMSSWGTHVIIADSTVTGNTAPWGGGLHLTGNSIVDRTTVDGNSAPDYGGGGIYNHGMMYLIDSAVTNNSAVHGGGVANVMGGTLEAGNTTISGNLGGGLFNDQNSHTDLESCTVTDNHAGFSEHSGLMNWNELRLHNTIIAANTPFNCANPITSLGHNLDDDASCGLATHGDLSGTDPLLEPLADNGGPTMTHALPFGSPAIDAGDPADFPSTDQRGYDRPNDGDSNGIAAPDIGAFENTEMVFTDGFESGDLTRWSSAVP